MSLHQKKNCAVHFKDVLTAITLYISTLSQKTSAIFLKTENKSARKEILLKN